MGVPALMGKSVLGVGSIMRHSDNGLSYLVPYGSPSRHRLSLGLFTGDEITVTLIFFSLLLSKKESDDGLQGEQGIQE